MGKLDVKVMRYLTREDFRILTAIEMGMKNHELVPVALVTQIANLRYGGLHKILKNLCKHRLLSYETTKRYEGYRLTNRGYDYLALKTLTSREVIDSFGNQIGVGKESNIYVVSKDDELQYCLKLHRLGRICFRKVKNKRDYHEKRKYMSWLYLSRVSATKEFTFMKALHDRGFPVPKPIDFNRHCVIMELIEGVPLCNIREIEKVEQLYDDLMNMICKLAHYGLIHGDFNEFNIMLTADEKPILIDFPQMVATDHEEAELYFNRDVNCIREFFRRRFSYESSLYPIFEDVMNECDADTNLSKVIVTSHCISDDEDWEIPIMENYDREDVNSLQEGFSNLEVDEESTSFDDEDFKSSKDDSTSESEVASVKNVSPIPKLFDKLKTETDFSDVRSTASTIISPLEVKKRIRTELKKNQKRIEGRRNIKKCTISTKNRRENRQITKETMQFWGTD